MGSSSQLYSLSWGEFSSSLTSAVQLLRGDGDLVDVTVAAGGRSFPAHKIVLSAASPFLFDLLKNTPCQHPVVMLAGVTADDLESLLEFVYRGEVSVEPSQLPSLLQAAHCLSIHGLISPKIFTENGEEVPMSSIPSMSEEPAKEPSESYSNNPLQTKRKKRRKKSMTPINPKWQRTNKKSNESRTSDNHEGGKSSYYSKEEGGNALNITSDSEFSNHRIHSPISQPSDSISVESSHVAHQEHMAEMEPQLHTLMPMQPYSPLHIPQFSGSLNVGFAGLNIPMGSSTPGSVPSSLVHTSSQNSSKIRGASDCPGVCPLCGATLRQARNLRRHLLSSCKYRFNSTPNQTSVHDAMTIEIKPEVDLPGYTGQSYSSEGSNHCEQIVCNPSPLPSPTAHGSSVVSPRSNIPSPTITR